LLEEPFIKLRLEDDSPIDVRDLELSSPPNHEEVKRFLAISPKEKENVNYRAGTAPGKLEEEASAGFVTFEGNEKGE